MLAGGGCTRVLARAGDNIGGGTAATTRSVTMKTPEKPSETAPEAAAEAPHATLRQVAAAVFWSFFGVRKGRAMQQDTVTIKPVHVVIVGLVSGLVFVLALVALVKFITSNA
jgi:hypothetical protein